MIKEMGVLINELGSRNSSRKMKSYTAVNRNVQNFSLETEKTKFEINEKDKTDANKHKHNCHN